jgi:hypothetical protein
MSLTIFNQSAIPLPLIHMKKHLMFHRAPCSTVTHVTLHIHGGTRHGVVKTHLKLSKIYDVIYRRLNNYEL